MDWAKKKLQDEVRNSKVLGFGAAYIRCFTVSGSPIMLIVLSATVSLISRDFSCKWNIVPSVFQESCFDCHLCRVMQNTTIHYWWSGIMCQLLIVSVLYWWNRHGSWVTLYWFNIHSIVNWMGYINGHPIKVNPEGNISRSIHGQQNLGSISIII